MVFLWGLVFAFLTIWIIRSVMRNLPDDRLFDKYPGPPPLPILGNIWDLRTKSKAFQMAVKFLEDYGKLVKLYVGPTYITLLTIDYKLVELILGTSKMLVKSDNYRWLRPWLGSGLLISDGATWKKHRKIITPAFHFEILKQFVGTFESATDVLVKKLEARCDSGSFDLYPLVTLCTLDIICETSMGVKIDAQKNDTSDYVHSVEEMCRIVIDRALSIFKLFDSTFFLTRDYYVQKRALKILHEHSRNVIDSRIKEITSGKDKIGNEDNVMGVKRKTALLDLLLELSNDGKLMSYEEIREQVDTFMFAGHHTTASSICFTLYCLANNAEVQRKAYEEQQQLFGKDENPTITHNDLSNMNYLEMVIKESLRLYPPVPLLGRKVKGLVEYDGGFLPDNTNIGMSIYSIHRDPDNFEEPTRFLPERFENCETMLPFAYIPFSAGPRNCIGQKFAMLEMKSVISKLLRNFELLPSIPAHTLMLTLETVLKSENGVVVSVRRRNK